MATLDKEDIIAIISLALLIIIGWYIIYANLRNEAEKDCSEGVSDSRIQFLLFKCQDKKI